MTSIERQIAKERAVLAQQQEQYEHLSDVDLLDKMYRAMETAHCRIKELEAQMATAQEDYTNVCIGVRLLEEHLEIGGKDGTAN